MQSKQTILQLIWRSLAGILCVTCVTAASIGVPHTYAESVPATHKQGSIHGFLLLRSKEGKIIAVGDQTNSVSGDLIRSRLVFRFHDGSVDDEVATFRQGSVFRLIRDHHIQKGPSFPHPLDVNIDVPKGKVTWREMNGGKSEVKTEHMDLPADLVNGMMSLSVENFPANATEFKVSYLSVDSKPRVVTLSIKPDGTETAYIGGIGRRASRYNVHVEIGGVAGLVAPVIGQQPPDMKIWVLDGEVPAFAKMTAPLYEKGPIWTMLLTSPSWSPPSRSR